jgi:hypothetical protein
MKLASNFKRSTQIKVVLLISLFLISGFATSEFALHGNITGLRVASAVTPPPFGIDGHDARHSSEVASSVTSTLSTSYSNDTIIAFGVANGTNADLNVTGASLTWNIGDLFNSSGYTEALFWAVAPSPLSSASITLNSNISSLLVFITFGVSDANINQTFDINPPSDNNSGYGTNPEAEYETAYPDTLVFGVGTSSGSPTFTAGTGFKIIDGIDYGPSLYAEYKTITAPKSVTAQFTLSASKNWAMFEYAIVEAPQTNVPFGIDTSASASCLSATSCSVTLNTNYMNDLVYIVALSGTSSRLSISDSDNLNWMDSGSNINSSASLSRAIPIGGATYYQLDDYVVLGITLSSDQITVTSPDRTTINVIAFSVSNVNIYNPFDSLLTGNGFETSEPSSTVTNVTVPINATTSTGMVLGVLALGGTSSLTLQSGYYGIATLANSPLSSIEYQSFSSTPGGNVSFAMSTPSYAYLFTQTIIADPVVSNTFTLTNLSWLQLHGADLGTQDPLNMSFQGSDNNVTYDLSQMKNNYGFNFIRVPLSWQQYVTNPTKFKTNLAAIASEADKLGIQAIYDAHTNGGSSCSSEPGFFFPKSGWTVKGGGTVGTGQNFLAQVWKDQLNYKGTDVWTAVWNQFWLPVTSIVNSHNSTFGYEMANEPCLGTASTGNLRNYYENIGGHLSALPGSRHVAFMGPHSGLNTYQDGGVLPTSVKNLVMDVHCYPDNGAGSCAPGINSTLYKVYQFSTLHSLRVWVGEWSPCNQCGKSSNYPAWTDAETGNITVFVNSVEHFDFANTYWIWSYDTKNTGTMLLDSTTHAPYWIDTDLKSNETNMQLK